MSGLSLEQGPDYQELSGWPLDGALHELARACIEEQQHAGESVRATAYEPDSTDGSMVSAEALNQILESGRDVAGLASEREISNALPFNQKSVARSVRSKRLARLRRRLDAEVLKRIGDLFRPEEDPVLAPAGHYWYPPGGYMGWHTNSRFPGWRVYISHSDEPGRSFFRYRDPATNEVITSYDDDWTVRLFRVSPDRLLWHAVYSETNRFSFGYLAHPWSPKRGLIRWGRRSLAGLDRLRGGIA